MALEWLLQLYQEICLLKIVPARFSIFDRPYCVGMMYSLSFYETFPRHMWNAELRAPRFNQTGLSDVACWWFELYGVPLAPALWSCSSSMSYGRKLCFCQMISKLFHRHAGQRLDSKMHLDYSTWDIRRRDCKSAFIQKRVVFSTL